MQVVIFKSPQRDISILLKELKGLDIHVIDSEETFGKELFWLRWELARQYCLASKHDNYLIIPDDVIRLDLKAIRRIHLSNASRKYTCSIINDGRNSCWGSKKGQSYKLGIYELTDIGFFDCGGLTNRITLERIEVNQVPEKWFKSRTSSGVGYQLTKKLRAVDANMFITSPSLCFHGDHESIMHKEERIKNPLISRPRMKIVIGIATFKGREEYLKKTIKSLKGQADQIRIYNNEERDIDLTDNGKFFFLQEYKEPVYYFSCDDDIIYPSTYVQDMINAIEKYKTIVTHHGRILLGKGRNYYRGHKAFRCTGLVVNPCQIHVAGTGVTAFRTDYFNPVEIWKSENKKMSDLVFSLEAVKQERKITVLNHKSGYIVAQPVPIQETIYGTEINDCSRQNELADSILNLLSL